MTQLEEVDIDDWVDGITGEVRDNDAEALRELARTLGRNKTASPDDLRRILSAVRRRRARSALGETPARELGAALATLEDTVQTRLAAHRVATQRADIERAERATPMHRAILGCLATSPASPTELAERLDVAKESVSRRLKLMTKKELVTAVPDPADGRRKVYALTKHGEVQAARHLTYGARSAAPAPPDRESVVAFLWAALHSAVELRRRTGRRDDVVGRLTVVCDQARHATAPELELRARTEFLATLRQAGRVSEIPTYLEELETIASGSHPAFPPSLALAAFGHLEYEHGRQAERDLTERAAHLVTAHRTFQSLEADRGDSLWTRRRGWALAALADNLRQQGELALALDAVRAALELFTGIGDVYGVVRGRFLTGFCLRLCGQFLEAHKHLEDAHQLAVDNDYELFAADALMQLGETRRCLGDYTSATAMLEEARGRASALGLPLTRAFAESSLAATVHAQGGDHQALTGLDAASELFEARQHADGMALNLRRWAVVQRASASGPGDLDEADRAVEKALGIYTDLVSPAGMAACLIESGYIAKQRRQSPWAQRGALRALLHTEEYRPLIELDPWVPSMLVAFADDVEDESLSALASSLLDDSMRRLGRLDEEVSLTFGSDDQLGRSCAVTVHGVDAMAAEHRRWRQEPIVALA
jgi:DNA-binding MarR family transcriptional regulator